MTNLKLIKYRDHHMSEYIWFWIDDNDNQVSKAFSSEEEALKWNMQDEWDSWKSIKEFV